MTAHGTRPNRRRKFLVDPSFQMGLMARLLLFLAVDLVLFFMLAVCAPAAFGVMTGQAEWGLMEALSRLDSLAVAIVLPLSCTFVVLFGQGIHETFRIAGPVFRLRSVLAGLRTRVLPRGVRIRKRDYLQDVADEMNAALVQLHDDVASLQQSIRDLHEHVTASAPIDADAVRRRVAELRDQVNRYQLCGQAPGGAPVDPVAPSQPTPIAAPVEPERALASR